MANKSCAEVFGYDPVRQIGPEPPIKVKTPWLQPRKTSIPIVSIPSYDSKPLPSLTSRKTSIPSGDSNPLSSLPSRKFSVDSKDSSRSVVDSFLSNAQPSPLSPSIPTTSYPSSRWQQRGGGSRWDTKISDLAPLASASASAAAAASSAELNGTSHWLKSADALPNLMDDFPAADEGEDDASAMPPLEPLTPTKLVRERKRPINGLMQFQTHDLVSDIDSREHFFLLGVLIIV